MFSEARMLLLGGQVLLGFIFRICFEKKFEQLARPAQLAEMIGLGIMTAALGWLNGLPRFIRSKKTDG